MTALGIEFNEKVSTQYSSSAPEEQGTWIQPSLSHIFLPPSGQPAIGGIYAPANDGGLGTSLVGLREDIATWQAAGSYDLESFLRELEGG